MKNRTFLPKIEETRKTELNNRDFVKPKGWGTDPRDHPDYVAPNLPGKNHADPDRPRRYLWNSKEEKAEYEQPLRTIYKHLSCGSHMKLDTDIAKEFCKDHTKYTKFWCLGCDKEVDIGNAGDEDGLVWVSNNGFRMNNVTEG